MTALLDKPSKTTHGLIVQVRSGAHFVTPFFGLPGSYAIAAANSIAAAIQRMSDTPRSFSSRSSTVDEKLHRSGSEGNETFILQRAGRSVIYFLAPKQWVNLPTIKIVKSVTELPERKQSLRLAIKNTGQK
jgi:hypothetical protein